jgi:hypothetical protein
MTAVLILDPAATFSVVHRRFIQARWRGGATTLTPPLLPGEPELAVWRRGESVARYALHPIVWLRTLRVNGSSPLPLLNELSDHDVLALLWAVDRTDCLRGIMAAGELELEAAESRLAELASSSADRVLAHFAQEVLHGE